MNGTSSITTGYSLWFVLLCIVVGALYSWFLYSAKSPWNKRVNYLLSFFRFALVTIICLLLLDWVVNRSTSTVEKPVVVIAVDNSQSIALNTDTTTINNTVNSLKKLKSDLEKEGKEVHINTFNNVQADLDGIQFNTPQTNINSLLTQVSDNFEGRNLSGVVLVSDGIYNQGMSPAFSTFTNPVFTVGLGDTASKKDLILKSIGHNKIAYKDNIFPIRVEVQNEGFKNQKTEVLLLKGSKTLARKEIEFKAGFDIQEFDFQTSSAETGIQHYVIKIVPLNGEFTEDNNVRHVYIEILDGKEEILCVALTPHPDIKAMKAAIEKSSNINFKTHIVSRGDKLDQNGNYDLIIFHQIPNRMGKGKNLLQKFTADKKSMLFVVGNQTDINQLNAINNCVKIRHKRNQSDDVGPYFNDKFDLFTFDSELKSRLTKYPPIQVPFGDYTLKGESVVMLNQKVGSVETQKPALILNTENESKHGVLCGEGIWRWRLSEYAENENTLAFDQLIQKTIQSLSAKNDKRKFRLYTNNTEYSEFDEITFIAAAYNDIYENIYNQKVFINLTNESGETENYQFTTSEINSRYKIKNLKEGIYKYSGFTEISGKKHNSSGQFIVRKVRLESANLTANHHLLKQIAENSGAKFVYPKQINSLTDYFNSDAVAGVIHTDTERDALINEKWIFFLLLALATLEWGLRKNKGGY